jgi:hypothetical protein
MPWQGEGSKANAGEDFSKYKYHPQGDSKNPPREAPSALHSVIIPNVNLPKVRYISQLIRVWTDEV